MIYIMSLILRNYQEATHLGYDVKLCDNNKVFQKYKCPLCFLLLRHPIQTERGELACEYWYNETKRNTAISRSQTPPRRTEKYKYPDGK